MRNNIELAREFRSECRERMQRAGAALNACGNTLTSSVCYQSILQEVDSLYGAARAADMREWEQFSDKMRILVAHLAGKLPAADQCGHELLKKGIDLSLRCGGDISGCLMVHYAEAEALMKEIQQHLESNE